MPGPPRAGLKLLAMWPRSGDRQTARVGKLRVAGRCTPQTPSACSAGILNSAPCSHDDCWIGAVAATPANAAPLDLPRPTNDQSGWCSMNPPRPYIESRPRSGRWRQLRDQGTTVRTATTLEEIDAPRRRLATSSGQGEFPRKRPTSLKSALGASGTLRVREVKQRP